MATAFGKVRLVIGAAICGLVLGSPACAPGAGAGRDIGKAEPEERAVRVNVTNLHNGPITVYAVGSGISYRMGTVLPGLASQFTVRPVMVGSGTVEFVAQAGNGDQPVRSGPLLLSPGKSVDFRIASQLLNSSATIRP